MTGIKFQWRHMEKEQISSCHVLIIFWQYKIKILKKKNSHLN